MTEQLLSAEVQQYIRDHQNDDPFLLSLKSKKMTGFPVKQAIEQIRSFQKAKQKLPSWAGVENIIWPAPVSVEQASSEITAKFKASLISGSSMADLTGGMGVDTVSFAENFKQVYYVEPETELYERTVHNFNVLGKRNIQTLNETSENFLERLSQEGIETRLDLLFLDPSRRKENRKVFKIEDCSPDLNTILPKCHEVADQVLIKLSPMVDISLLIQQFNPSTIWIVAIRNEVKEIVILLRRGDHRAVRIETIDIKAHGEQQIFKFSTKQEVMAKSEFSMPVTYLYEPNAAILKAGAFKLIGSHFKLKKLHQNTHLYTSDKLIHEFPGRVFQIKDFLKPNQKEVLRTVPKGKINVISRNYPLKTEGLKKGLKLQDGGDDYLIGTTLMDGKSVLLWCSRLN